MDYKNLRITQPVPASDTFHIFDKDNGNRSLCGKYGMLRMSDEVSEPVTGKEKWQKGQDCKACFKKAGLVPQEPKKNNKLTTEEAHDWFASLGKAQQHLLLEEAECDASDDIAFLSWLIDHQAEPIINFLWKQSINQNV